MSILLLPRTWEDVSTFRAIHVAWRWLRSHDLRPVAATALLPVELGVATRSVQFYAQFHSAFAGELHRTPFGGTWGLRVAIEDAGLLAAGLFLLLALSAFILTLVATRPETAAGRRMLDALRPLHMVLLGAVLVALVGIVLLGNWPVSWYLQSPVGLALGALLLTAGGQLWPGCGRGGGWLARLAAHLPLLHLLAVVFAGWCVYARTLGCVVDVIL